LYDIPTYRPEAVPPSLRKIRSTRCGNIIKIFLSTYLHVTKIESDFLLFVAVKNSTNSVTPGGHIASDDQVVEKISTFF
jgi:uncharacterized membrane protein